MGRHEEAIAELRRAVELDPVSVLYLSDLGWVYYMARQYDAAIEYLQRALELEPDAVDGHRGLGEVYVQKGMYDEAITHMQKYVELTEGAPIMPLAILAMPTAWRASATKHWRSSRRYKIERSGSMSCLRLCSTLCRAWRERQSDRSAVAGL